MRYEAAVLKSIEELTIRHPEFKMAFHHLMIRAGQLTTDTSKCEKCGGGG